MTLQGCQTWRQAKLCISCPGLNRPLARIWQRLINVDHVKERKACTSLVHIHSQGNSIGGTFYRKWPPCTCFSGRIPLRPAWHEQLCEREMLHMNECNMGSMSEAMEMLMAMVTSRHCVFLCHLARASRKHQTWVGHLLWPVDRCHASCISWLGFFSLCLCGTQGPKQTEFLHCSMHCSCCCYFELLEAWEGGCEFHAWWEGLVHSWWSRGWTCGLHACLARGEKSTPNWSLWSFPKADCGLAEKGLQCNALWHPLGRQVWWLVWKARVFTPHTCLGSSFILVDFGTETWSTLFAGASTQT